MVDTAGPAVKQAWRLGWWQGSALLRGAPQTIETNCALINMLMRDLNNESHD